MSLRMPKLFDTQVTGERDERRVVADGGSAQVAVRDEIPAESRAPHPQVGHVEAPAVGDDAEAHVGRAGGDGGPHAGRRHTPGAERELLGPGAGVDDQAPRDGPVARAAATLSPP